MVCINAKQFDTNSRFIEVTCTEKGKKYVLNSDSITAFIRYQKADGYYAFNKANEITADGTAIFELTQQMLAVTDKTTADIMIIDTPDFSLETIADIEDIYQNGASIISTMSFYINITKFY